MFFPLIDARICDFIPFVALYQDQIQWWWNAPCPVIPSLFCLHSQLIIKSKFWQHFYKGYSNILSFSLDQHPGTVFYPVFGCMVKLLDFRRLILCLNCLLQGHNYLPPPLIFFFWWRKNECGKDKKRYRERSVLPTIVIFQLEAQLPLYRVQFFSGHSEQKHTWSLFFSDRRGMKHN